MFKSTFLKLKKKKKPSIGKVKITGSSGFPRVNKFYTQSFHFEYKHQTCYLHVVSKKILRKQMLLSKINKKVPGEHKLKITNKT